MAKTLYIYTVSYCIKGSGRGRFSTKLSAYNAVNALRSARQLAGRGSYAFNVTSRKKA